VSATIAKELYGEVAKAFYSFDSSTSGYVTVGGQQVSMRNTSTVVTSDGPTTYYILTGTFDTNGGTLTQISFTTSYTGRAGSSGGPVTVKAQYIVNLNVSLTAGTYPLLVVVTLQPGTVTLTLPQ